MFHTKCKFFGKERGAFFFLSLVKLFKGTFQFPAKFLFILFNLTTIPVVAPFFLQAVFPAILQDHLINKFVKKAWCNLTREMIEFSLR